MMKIKHPTFVAGNAVASQQNLVVALDLRPEKFAEILSRKDAVRFRKKEIAKKNGVGVREVYCPDWDLRILLRRFNSRFFANTDVVKWPYFLYGCTPNCEGPGGGRDYISCARVHQNARSLLKVDIANFFPSITEAWVRQVFTDTLKFSAPLAKNMAALNCVDGALVQGSPSASYIAGAIFGRDEGLLVDRLNSKGFVYTRYVDDITISSQKRAASYALCLRLIDDLFSKHDLERNIAKTVIHRSGASSLIVHGIKVGGGKISLPRTEFKAIRASVNTLAVYAKSESFRSSLHYRRMFMRCMGRVGKLARSKDRRSKGYYNRLRSIRPRSTQVDIALCTRWVDEVERNSASRSTRYFHIRQFNRTWARLSILAWTYPEEARALRERLKKYAVSYAKISL